jgi:6-phosphogluconolactonase
MSRMNNSREAIEWRLFDEPAAMARRVADEVQSIIGSAIEARGSAFIALPGGGTPVPIFAELAAREIQWSLVTLLPTDDRLVPIDDPLSNAGLIRTWFGGTGARLVTLFDGGGSGDDAGRAADRKLRTLRWPLDLVWLGMGEDGHTASILPGPDFDAALSGQTTRLACVVTPDPLPAEAPVARVTLIRAALVATRSLILTITGEKKRAVAEQAMEDGPLSSLAIGRVLGSAPVPAEIYWSK